MSTINYYERKDNSRCRLDENIHQFSKEKVKKNKKDNSRCRLDKSIHQFSKEKMHKRKSFSLYDFLEKSLKSITFVIILAPVLLLTFVAIISFIGIVYWIVSLFVGFTPVISAFLSITGFILASLGLLFIYAWVWESEMFYLRKILKSIIFGIVITTVLLLTFWATVSFIEIVYYIVSSFVDVSPISVFLSVTGFILSSLGLVFIYAWVWESKENP